MVAVITADLVDSSLYEEEFLNSVLNTLQLEFEKIQNEYGQKSVQFEIYRGDSFQGIIQEPKWALRIGLQIKTAVNQIPSRETSSGRAVSKLADFNLALGIGSLELQRDSIAESNGQAFQFSGRTLDEMKSETQCTKIKTIDEEINEEFNTSFFLMDLLMDKWSTASAEVVYHLMQGLKEREIAERIKISQSAVNQRKKASGWEAIAKLVERYERVMDKKLRP